MTNLPDMPTARRLALATLAMAGIAVASCGGDRAPQTSTSGSAVAGSVVVFAASSLTEAFTEMGTAFQVANPDATVTFNFAGSGDLVTQINEGAPADVYASADDSNMAKLTEAGGNATEPVVVARNTFEIIVGPGNPKGLDDLTDLADPDLIVVLCADTVPCGKGAAKVLANAGVTVTPKSYEEKVKGVVTKVTAGEADAGIVFATDVQAAGDAAAGVPIAPDVNVVSNYPIVVTMNAPNAAAAQAFVAFVAGAEGQAILAKYGFLPA
jgi:molybdate transport system substrate-binding protein